MDVSEKNHRVLSIQSHVVSGYVGNKSSCFPLQLLGFEVDFINSVQFSNHTGYQCIKGQVLKSEELKELYDGLKANNLLCFSHVLTGYVGDASFLSKLCEIIKDMKSQNPNLYVVCDPVMGDNGQMYVPDDILPIYTNEFTSISNLITPNQFEAELLTGVHIKSKETVFEAINIMHKKGVETVVLSSVSLDTSQNLFLFGSSIKGKQVSVFMEIPKLAGRFTGSGDVFSALLVAWMTKTDGDLKVSCEKVINTMQCILKRTLQSASKKTDPTAPFSMELKLIQSKRDIENPPNDLECHYL